MDDELQLDLFTWDRVMVREGFSALARLDFLKAQGTFQDVLARWPGHPDASAGLGMAATWADSLRDVKILQRREAAGLLWERLQSYPFGQSGGELRRTLIQRAITLMEEDADSHISPDSCLGRLYFEMEDYGRAEAAFRRILETQPRDGRLLVWLGNCLFIQRKTSEARVVYARAFLSAPSEVNLEEIEDKELVEAVADEEVYSAAIWGWLRGVLPLIEMEVESPHDRKHENALLVYHTLRCAEKARAKAAYEEMVEQRRLLRKLSPTVFLQYMSRM